MDEAEEISVNMIRQHFELVPSSPENKDNLQQVRAVLIDKIDYLLSHDFEKLLWILYRVDVNETKAKEMLVQHSAEKPSEILADLIIEREMQKAITRIKFRKDGSTSL
jgi:hypothetical protein